MEGIIASCLEIIQLFLSHFGSMSCISCVWAESCSNVTQQGPPQTQKISGACRNFSLGYYKISDTSHIFWEGEFFVGLICFTCLPSPINCYRLSAAYAVGVAV